MKRAERGNPEVDDSPGRSFRSPLRAAALGIALGVGFEVLLDRHPLGVSFLLWVALAIAGLLWLSSAERSRVAPPALLLAGLALIFAAMVAVRAEPMTTFINLAAALALGAWFLRAFRKGDLANYDAVDLALVPVTVPVESAVRPWGTLSQASRTVFGERTSRSGAAGVVRGLLLALPVVIVFAAFLAGADLVFADSLERILRWLNLENLIDVVGRVAIVLGVGIGCLGAIVAALRPSPLARRLGLERLNLPPFLGSAEALVVLGAVDLLFASFVAIQFRYLFGGHQNILEAGYTYSEYARRGFGELMAVAVLSLGMIVFLGVWSRRERPGARAAFLGLSAVLVALVGAMLASALTRLLLYEQAYGFTRLRTYTHAAIIWMAVLFGLFLFLLWRDRLRGFGLAVVIAGLGWTGTLDALGVDGFIVRQNGAAWEQGGELDSAYLRQLSDDAIPDLARLALAAEPDDRQELLAGLACRRAILRAEGERAWPYFHWGRARAQQQLEAIGPALASFHVKKPSADPWTWSVVAGGEEWSCAN